MHDALLSIENLSVGYGATPVLHGINMSMAPGELRVVLGANGAGKSTLIKSILGMARKHSGRVNLETQDITTLPPHRVSASGIAWVPEGRQIFSTLSVTDNLLLGAFASRSQSKIKERLSIEFDRFPVLGRRRRQDAGTLSGGEQTMLAISRALMSDPKIILMDEPSLGLAPLIVAELFNTIEALNQEGTSILLVEQNARQAVRIADWVYVLETGNIVAEGTAETINSDDRVMRAYLGA